MNGFRWYRACLWLLAAALAVAPSVATPEEPSRQLRESVSLAKLRFVGAAMSGRNVQATLTRDDVAMLVAARQPISLNRLINRGIPVRASRIQQLIEWGLMRQVGMEFQSLVPVIGPGQSDGFDQILDRIAPTVIEEMSLALETVYERVWRHPGVPSMPALTAWILRDRAWAQLQGPTGLNLRAFVDQQREFMPDRGFWGLLWYSDEPPSFPYEFLQSRVEDYTLLLAWNPGEPENPFSGVDGTDRMQRFLEKLEQDGRELDDADEFPELIDRGVVEPGGDMRVYGNRYRIRDTDGLARLVEQAAADIATVFLNRVPTSALSDALGGVSRELAMTLAYVHIVSRSVEQLSEGGLPVEVGDPRARWRDESEMIGGERSERVRVTVTDQATGENLGVGPPPIPRFSMMIWRDLETQPFMELPW